MEFIAISTVALPVLYAGRDACMLSSRVLFAHAREYVDVREVEQEGEDLLYLRGDRFYRYIMRGKVESPKIISRNRTCV